MSFWERWYVALEKSFTLQQAEMSCLRGKGGCCTGFQKRASPLKKGKIYTHMAHAQNAGIRKDVQHFFSRQLLLTLIWKKWFSNPRSRDKLHEGWNMNMFLSFQPPQIHPRTQFTTSQNPIDKGSGALPYLVPSAL